MRKEISTAPISIDEALKAVRLAQKQDQRHKELVKQAYEKMASFNLSPVGLTQEAEEIQYRPLWSPGSIKTDCDNIKRSLERGRRLGYRV